MKVLQFYFYLSKLRAGAEGGFICMRNIWIGPVRRVGERQNEKRRVFKDSFLKDPSLLIPFSFIF